MRLSLGAILGLIATSPVLAGEREIEEFHRDYPAAVARLVSFAETLSGKVEIVESNAVTKKTTRFKGEFSADRGLFRLVMDSAPGKTDNVTAVIGAGPGGTYTLLKDAKAKDDSFGVISLGGEALDQERANQRFGRYLHASYSLGGSELNKLTRASTLRNLSVEPLEMNGRSLRRLKFDVGRDESVNRIAVNLDPSASWAVVDWTLEVRMSDSGRFTKTSGSVEYGPPIDGMPVPKTVRISDVGGKSYVAELTNLSRPAVPPERFSMTDFGLPELIRLESPGSGWSSVVGIVFASACGIVVALIARGVFRGSRWRGEHRDANAPT